MKNSAQRIRTSHVGRLPAPSGFAETALRLARGTRPLKPGEVGSMRANRRASATSTNFTPTGSTSARWVEAGKRAPPVA
jgi:hypothetical protein